MQDTASFQEFYAFMEEYTNFLDKMLGDEKEKLSALSSRELKRIEHSLTVAQANAKQLENYETKRIQMQRTIGCGGLTFHEIIERAPEQKQSWLHQLFANFERSVNEIRYRNDKSMTVARDNMMLLDPGAILPGQGAANPYSRIQKEEKDKNGILETKV